ncbi:MAG: imidazole glycerol phosphate synthase subunit HisH [Lactobacillaceae bacterium]|jgi:glutamine amidotransferase|nr:imidazole glycerol phosphate synthase subunit HisH [Lactobacillaceae bacterium]
MAKANMIAVIDYGAGNIRNVMKAINYVGLPAKLTKDPQEIAQAAGVVIPGVGAFKTAMEQMQANELVVPIQRAAKSGTPILGVCLGMQLLFDSSTEFGKTTGLGLIPGEVVELPQNSGYKVPQMGWNENIVQQASPITTGLAGEYTYFVHSYYVQTAAEYIAATVDYGVQVPSVVNKDNIWGAQFHPEKSGDVGLKVWQAFAKMVEENA